MNRKPSEVTRLKQMLTGAAPAKPQNEEDAVAAREPAPKLQTEHSSALYGGGNSLNDMKEMWGGRASRALESLGGKSTGRTSFENEALKKKHFSDQKVAEARALAAGQELSAAKGESRAALRRKKKRGVLEPGTAPSKKPRLEPSPRFRKRLEAYYKRYAPEKLKEKSKMQTLLEKFSDDAESLFALLTAKYGPEGMQPALVTSGKAKQIQENSKDDKADAILDEYDRLQRKSTLSAAASDEGKAPEKKAPSVHSAWEAPTQQPFSYNTREEVQAMDSDLEKLNALNVNFFMQQARAKPRREEE